MTRIVAVTACPTGVAHTIMAAEALKQTAEALGHQIAVETQGARHCAQSPCLWHCRRSPSACADLSMKGQ